MIPYGVIPRILAAYFLMICGTCRSSGRVEAHSAMGRFQFLWYEYENVGRLIDQMGFAARYSKYGSVGRDSTGERLFLDFRATELSNMVAIVLTQSVRVKALRGFGAVNDSEEQVCWQDLRDSRWHFANGYVLPSSEHVLAVSGHYVAIRESGRTNQWIALADTPTNILISLPANIRVDRMFAKNRIVHLFYFQQQAKAANGDTDEVLNLVTYSLERGKPKEQRRRMFAWASRVFDMDPDGNLATFRPKQTYLAHGVLVELDSGRKIQLGIAGDMGVFLEAPAIRRFHELSR